MVLPLNALDCPYVGADMMWLERLVAKLDRKIGNVEAWWVRADWNSRSLAIFFGFIAFVFLTQVVRAFI